MSDILTSAESDSGTDIPNYPIAKSASCPFAPPQQIRELGAEHPVSRVRIWDGSTPWLITGHEVARELFADARVSVDDRRSGFPHWNEMMVSTVK